MNVFWKEICFHMVTSHRSGGLKEYKDKTFKLHDGIFYTAKSPPSTKVINLVCRLASVVWLRKVCQGSINLQESWWKRIWNIWNWQIGNKIHFLKLCIICTNGNFRNRFMKRIDGLFSHFSQFTFHIHISFLLLVWVIKITFSLPGSYCTATFFESLFFIPFHYVFPLR